MSASALKRSLPPTVSDWSPATTVPPVSVAPPPSYEHDTEIVYPQEELDLYRLHFGMYKGQTLREVMRTQRGRSWLKWYKEQPAQEEFADSNRKMVERIDFCFTQYDAWLQEHPAPKRQCVA